MASRVALFDLDRTLIRGTSAELYTRFRRDLGEIGWTDTVRVAFWVLEYTFGVIDAERVAERALRDVTGQSEVWLRERCRKWFDAYVRDVVSERGRDVVAHHLGNGDGVAIVTAASRYAAEPVAEFLGIPEIVGTELELSDGVFTGKFLPPLCYREGKLERVKSWASARGVSLTDAAFYTDSITDLPLLEAVGEPVCVNPDGRLVRRARRNQWRVERW